MKKAKAWLPDWNGLASIRRKVDVRVVPVGKAVDHVARRLACTAFRRTAVHEDIRPGIAQQTVPASATGQGVIAGHLPLSVLVIAAAAVQLVVAAIAGDQVGRTIAGAADTATAGQGQVFRGSAPRVWLTRPLTRSVPSLAASVMVSPPSVR